MDSIFTFWSPWILLGIILFAIGWALRLICKRSRLRCPACDMPFGTRAAYMAKPYYRNGTLDGPMIDLDGIGGQDGFIIHCRRCGIQVLFDNKSKVISFHKCN